VESVESGTSDDQGFAGRVLPSRKSKPDELVREISNLVASRSWRLEELHREEGRLDEVFRSITRSDTAA
jgi:ABC-2 type transport system ATP-binding protein